MQLIIISPNKTKHQHWHLSPMHIVSLIGLALLIITALSYTAYHFFISSNQSNPVIQVVEKKVIVESESLTDQQEQMHAYYAKQLGSLQAEAIRLKALTTKIADMAGIDIAEQGFTDEPALGGITETGRTIQPVELENYFEQLQSNFDQQQTGLDQIQDYLIQEDNIMSAIPKGNPVKKGWVSSYYGYRIDPFTGKKAFHKGIDIAGKEGTEVRSVADGIVTWQGNRGGYGKTIEIDHGNGYQTRYAHNKKLVVELGDKIERGQAIALMGSTGRSTGPHVHFEVLRDGKTINPANFLK